jgi:hypothetical protein
MILFENGSTTALQSSNTFVNIPGGFHELIVEKDGCGLVKEVCSTTSSSILTPNGDGANDYWNLKGLNGSIYKTRKYSFSIDTESCRSGTKNAQKDTDNFLAIKVESNH